MKEIMKDAATYTDNLARDPDSPTPVNTVHWHGHRVEAAYMLQDHVCCIHLTAGMVIICAISRDEVTGALLHARLIFSDRYLVHY